MLGPRDRLPDPPHRILVAGSSGAGKTTLAARVARILEVRHVELDALHHGPGWEPRASFVDDVDALVAEESWVTEWQYGSVRERLADRATLLVWLDPPTAVWLGRLVRRTAVRRLRRTELWNGNVEPPLRTVLTDPEHVVRYAWRHRRRHRAAVPALHDARPDLPVVRLRSQAEVERWVAGLPRPGERG